MRHVFPSSSWCVRSKSHECEELRKWERLQLPCGGTDTNTGYEVNSKNNGEHNRGNINQEHSSRLRQLRCDA
eukprot:9397730-Heterocapsa_arctica.AAC.1